MHYSNTGRIVAALSLCLVAGVRAQQVPTAGKVTAVPRLIRFAGTSQVTDKQPSAGVMGARFAIYRQQDGGTPLWSEVQNVELDASGNYVAVLGSTSNEGVPAELFVSHESRWLEVEFQVPGAIPQPRILMASVPYAMKAADADTLGGRPASDYLLAGSMISPAAGTGTGSTTMTGVSVMEVHAQPRVDSGQAGFIAKFSSATDVVDSVLFENNGFVGFGTTSPNHGLHVFNNSAIADSNLNGQLYVQNTFPTGSSGHASLVLDKGSATASAALAFNSATSEIWDVGATDDNHFHIRTFGGSNTKPLTIEQHAPSSSLYVNSTGNVGVGTAVPAAKLEVNGNAQVDGNLTLSGNILGPGLVGTIIVAPNNGTNNFSAGIGSLPSSATGSQNTGVGDGTLAASTSASNNSALGSGALAHVTSGGSNTAVGRNALNANTLGFQGTAVGDSALASNTIGLGNVAVGALALTTNTSGQNNTAVGTTALQINNNQSNVAVGSNALSANANGQGNTALGYSALSSSTGSTNVAIGNLAGFAVQAGSNNILISHIGAQGDSGVIRIGSPGTQSAAFIAGIRGSTTINNDAIAVMIDSQGQLGTVSSSRRFKEDIQDMADASDGLMRLRPVTFRYKTPFGDGAKPVQYGLIAEEVEEVYPDLVAHSADGQIETVKYQVLDSMLLNEVQKQKATIKAQAEEIHSLEDRLARLEAALESRQK